MERGREEGGERIRQEGSVIDTETAIQLIGELYWSCAGITANASTLEIEVLAKAKNGELLKS